MKSRISVLFFIFSLLFSCAKPHGEFAFKVEHDKGYRINPERLEFDSNKKMMWIYSFKNIRSRIKLGVVILKRELSWVDVLSRPDYVDSKKKIVYGTFNNYEPGDYRIIITQIDDDGSAKIDECTLYLYSDSDSFD